VNPFEYTNSPTCRHLASLGNCILYNQFSYSLVLDGTDDRNRDLPDTNTLTITLPGRWFSLRTSVSPTNKTDRHDIAEILLKVALNTITLTRPSCPNVYLVRTKNLRSDYFPNSLSSVNFKHIFFHHNICYKSLNMTHISANH
jgi:hypothetical protein